MIPDFTGNYLTLEGTKDGDIVKILTEGKMEFSEALRKDTFNIQVEHNQKVKTYSPSNKAGKALQEAFGPDTKDWIGKTFQVLHVDKKMVVRPLI